MSRLVTRRRGSLVLHCALTLLPGRDDDLIAVLREVPNGKLASVLRAMLRTGARAVDIANVEDDEVDLSGLAQEL